MLYRYLEFVNSDLDAIKSFDIKDELNPKVWEGFKIKVDVRDQLLRIANDFYKSLELPAEIKDIILTGSLANYNWSDEYSDFDLHVLIDFSDINSDIDLVRKYTTSIKNEWNKKHDIKISGYDVEVYLQDFEEIHTSTGVYSLFNDVWNVKPNKLNVKIEEDMILSKSKLLMSKIDDLELILDDYDYFNKSVTKVWDKIKNYRKSGLQESGEYSVGNLVFKLLRRNGYIGKIIDMKTKAYDKQFK